MPNNNTNTSNVATPATTPAENATPTTRTRKPREKVRPLEVLKGIENVKSLSDKEKTILIEHYRAELNRVESACNSYKANAEAAFEKSRMLENAYNHCIEINNAKLNDVVQAASTFYKTIYLIAKDGKQND